MMSYSNQGLDRFVRRPEVENLTALSRSSIYEKLSPHSCRYDPKFPRPVKIGQRAVAWRLSEVEAWIAACGKANI